MAVKIPQTTLEQVMTYDGVETTLKLVAGMAGLTKRTTARIVEAGLPMMAVEADDDPYIFKAMFAQSMKALPSRTAEYYTLLGNDPQAQQALSGEFRAIYGSVTDALNREAGRRANATEAQASQVLAATMPVVVKALGLQNTQRNEMGFGRLLRSLKAQEALASQPSASTHV